MCSDLPVDLDKVLLGELCSLSQALLNKTGYLEDLLEEAGANSNTIETATFFKENLIPAMGEVRCVADRIESRTAAEYWPFPTYGEMLFTV